MNDAFCVDKAQGWISPKMAHLLTQFIRKPKIVVIEESNEFPLSSAKAPVAGYRKTCLFLMDISDPRIQILIPLDHLPSIVR